MDVLRAATPTQVRVEIPPPVLTKDDYYRRWWAFEFGNRILAWDSVEALEDSNYSGLVTIRYKERGSPWCGFNFPPETVRGVLAGWISEGAEPLLFTFNESMRDECLTIQGEVLPSYRGYELFYSHVPAPMRIALQREPRYALGLTARCILKHFMDPSSYEDLELLFDHYPDHVVEFSCYSYDLGAFPHRNTIIWEVRNY